MPGGRLRHAVIAGPAAGVDLGYPVLAGKVFVIAAELDGETKVGDPYGKHDAYRVIAADRNAYLHSPLGVEMYGGIEYALPEAARAREGVLAGERRHSP